MKSNNSEPKAAEGRGQSHLSHLNGAAPGIFSPQSIAPLMDIFKDAQIKIAKDAARLREEMMKEYYVPSHFSGLIPYITS